MGGGNSLSRDSFLLALSLTHFTARDTSNERVQPCAAGSQEQDRPSHDSGRRSVLARRSPAHLGQRRQHHRAPEEAVQRRQAAAVRERWCGGGVVRAGWPRRRQGGAPTNRLLLGQSRDVGLILGGVDFVQYRRLD